MKNQYEYIVWLIVALVTTVGSGAVFVASGPLLNRMFPDDDYLFEKVFLICLSVVLFGSICGFASWMTWPREHRDTESGILDL